MLQGQTIVGLGAPRIAGEVIGKPAVSSKALGGNTQARGLAEEAERGGVLLQQYEGGAHARLHSPVARRDLLGPREKVSAVCGSPSESAASPAPRNALLLRGDSARVRRCRDSVCP